MVRILPVDHREQAVAVGIHAVMSLAYAQEARLLGLEEFPPAARTVKDIQASEDFHIGVVADENVVAVLSICPDEEPSQLCISALVVHPEFQRQGFGRLLVLDALARGQGAVFAVATAAANAPALALYAALGFVPYRQGVIGPSKLPLVKLRRAA